MCTPSPVGVLLALLGSHRWEQLDGGGRWLVNPSVSGISSGHLLLVSLQLVPLVEPGVIQDSF